MLEYLIVGSGLAGISFSETLERNRKSFKVISDHSQTSSIVAGGLVNPVILKRFTLAWRAQEQLALAKHFYKSLEKKLDVSLYYSLPIVRRFVSVEEQNQWFEQSDRDELKAYLSDNIQNNTNGFIDAPLGFGRVKNTARVDTKQLVSHYTNHLLKKNLLLEERFDFDFFRIEEHHIEYKTIKARQIVFSEGFGMKDNPYFNYLPLNGNKGEYVFVKAPQLKLNSAIKSAFFCIPEGDDIYRIGANYDRNDKTNSPTGQTRKELLKKWIQIYKCPYDIVDHVAGIRPTVIDRKPLVGRHPKLKNLFVLNGFGSRGVMIAPYVSKQLYRYIEKKEALPAEMDIERFTKKYFSD